jgi:hypothetical protein
MHLSFIGFLKISFFVLFLLNDCIICKNNNRLKNFDSIEDQNYLNSSLGGNECEFSLL